MVRHASYHERRKDKKQDEVVYSVTNECASLRENRLEVRRLAVLLPLTFP